MTLAPMHTNCTNISASRILFVFLILCTLFVTQSYWLPSAQTPSFRITSTNTVSDGAKPHYVEDKIISHAGSSAHATTTTATATVTVTESAVTTTTAAPAHDDGCSSAPDAHRVMIIMKTGASELEYKLPTHLITLLKCVPQGHFIVYSDMEQTFADYPVFDAVQNVSAPWKEKHSDFDTYRKIVQFREDGIDLVKLKGDQSWNLDKWKFLPMMHSTYEMSPDYIDWFVYMEADTSLSWLNLLQWLRTMDSNKDYYLGSQNVLGGINFAHGGSGFVLSRAAAKKLDDRRNQQGAEDYDQKWEELTSGSCCGDEVVARALVDAGVFLTGAWPVLQGEKVSTVDFTDRHWCTPPVTMHHVSPVEVDDLWHFQTSWVQQNGWNTPYLWRDVFSYFVSRHLETNRTDWNNICNDYKIVSPDVATDSDRFQRGYVEWDKRRDYERKAVESFEACAEACTLHGRKCVQYSFEPGRCHFGYNIRLGATDDRDGNKWQAGWNRERIDAYVKKNSKKCGLRWHV